jgi:hypothetical protein
MVAWCSVFPRGRVGIGINTPLSKISSFGEKGKRRKGEKDKNQKIMVVNLFPLSPISLFPLLCFTALVENLLRLPKKSLLGILTIRWQNLK